jgi:hypothetical protein
VDVQPTTPLVDRLHPRRTSSEGNDPEGDRKDNESM